VTGDNDQLLLSPMFTTMIGVPPHADSNSKHRGQQFAVKATAAVNGKHILSDDYVDDWIEQPVPVPSDSEGRQQQRATVAMRLASDNSNHWLYRA